MHTAAAQPARASEYLHHNPDAAAGACRPRLKLKRSRAGAGGDRAEGRVLKPNLCVRGCPVPGEDRGGQGGQGGDRVLRPERDLAEQPEE